MMPRATIIIPTLDLVRGAQVGAQAKATAGVPTCVVIVADHERRGGIIPAIAAMQAAQALDAPYIVYMNDDVTITHKRWLARMIDALESDPSYGIACPSGNCPGGPQRTVGPKAEPGIFISDIPLAWFCAVIKRALIERVGFFDAAFTHYCGDTDLTYRAQLAGWKTVWVRDVWVEHLGGEIDVELKRREKALCANKWGK